MINLTKEQDHTRFLPLLSMLYITASLATFMLAYKMSYIHNILISTGIFVFPLTYFFGAIVSEVYGYKAGRRMVFSGFLCQAIFSICLYYLVQLPPPPYWHEQEAYEKVLGSVFWFFLSNATGVLVGSFVNVYMISKWKNLVKGKYFVSRCITSSFIGEAITSIIADIMAFSSQLPVSELTKLMMAIYSVKIIYTICLAYPARYFCMKLKQIEDIKDYYPPMTMFTGVKNAAS